MNRTGYKYFLSVFKKEKNADKAIEILRKIENGEIIGTISTIVLLEISIIFCREGKKDEGRKAIELIQDMPNLIIVDFTPDLIELTTELKTKYKLGIGDSIVLSAPIALGADSFITYDEDFDKVKEIKIEKLNR